MQQFTRAALQRATATSARSASLPLRCMRTSLSRPSPIQILRDRRYYSSTPTSTAPATPASCPKILLQAPEHLNDKETEIFERLVGELEPVELEVQDISGGCGSMYGIQITSEKFRGLNMLKQQRLVNSVLGEEIKSWHGVQLRTKIP
ncbi:BolA-like protein [Phlyctema vagabunda]|uniref:BolA-like protein n=1 Tax=Phlyctema vagabunda TaxID=108571 RepID=A0ABR4PNU2_9HELO